MTKGNAPSLNGIIAGLFLCIWEAIGVEYKKMARCIIQKGFFPTWGGEKVNHPIA